MPDNIPPASSNNADTGTTSDAGKHPVKEAKPATANDGFWATVKARLRRVADKVCGTKFVQKGTGWIKAAVDWLPKFLFPPKVTDKLPGKKTGKSALKIAILLGLVAPFCASSRFWCLVAMAIALFCMYYALAVIRRNSFAVRGVFFATLALLFGMIQFSDLKEARRKIPVNSGSKSSVRDSYSSAEFSRDLQEVHQELDEVHRSFVELDNAVREFGKASERTWNDLMDSAQREYDDLDNDTKQEINGAIQEINNLFQEP